MVRALLVLPTFEEADNIARVLEAIRASNPEIDVLVVDDASPDGTAQIAETIGSKLGQVEVLSRPGKLGLGSAYKDGFRWGLQNDYQVLIEMDADFSHDPRDLQRLVAAVEEGADLAIGSRYVPGGSIPGWVWHRRILSRWGNVYARLMLGIEVFDMTSGFRAYRSSLLGKVPLDQIVANGYGFQIEMVREVVLAGGDVVELPIRFADRTAGRSKMSGRIPVEALAIVSRWGLQRLFSRARR